MFLDPRTIKILHEERVNQFIKPNERSEYQLFAWSNFHLARLWKRIIRLLMLDKFTIKKRLPSQEKPFR